MSNAAEFELRQCTSESVLAWLRRHVEINQYSSHARHVTSTTLIREYRDLLSCVTFLSDVLSASCEQW